MTNDEILAKVRHLLVEALSVDDDEVTPAARLQADLGAESIDILDIVFRLEREFGLGKIDRNELFPEAILQGDAEFVQNGELTPKGIEELKSKLSYADPAPLAAFIKDPKIDGIGDLFTVDTVVRFVQSKLAGK